MQPLMLDVPTVRFSAALGVTLAMLTFKPPGLLHIERVGSWNQHQQRVVECFGNRRQDRRRGLEAQTGSCQTSARPESDRS